MLCIYELERRRLRAIELLSQTPCPTQSSVAKQLGVARQTVCLWKRVAEAGGLEGIRAKRKGRPARPLLSDANPISDGLGNEYDVDTDLRFATNRHPMEDIEPEAASRHQRGADKMRAGMAWLVGKRWNPEAIARRAYAGALVLSGTLFDDTRIEELSLKMGGARISAAQVKAILSIQGHGLPDDALRALCKDLNKSSMPVSKQALSKNMSEFRDLILDDVPIPLANLRSQQSRDKMRAAMVKSHRERKAKL